MIIPIAPYLENVHKKIMKQHHTSSDVLSNEDSMLISMRRQDMAINTSQALIGKDNRSTMQSGTIAFNSLEGRGHISMLKQYHDEGAIVLQRLSEDGTMISTCLTRLPQSSTLETSYTTLLDTSPEKSDSMRVILHKAPDDQYCFGTQDFRLPVLLTRSTESMPQVIEKRLPFHIGELVEIENENKRRRIH